VPRVAACAADRFPRRRAAGAAAETRAPRSITITLTPQQADELLLWLRGLPPETVPPGDRVTVDLTDLQSGHVTGLALEMGRDLLMQACPGRPVGSRFAAAAARTLVICEAPCVR